MKRETEVWMPKLCIDTITFGSSVVLSSERARLYFDAKLVWQACKKPKEQRVNLQKESVGSGQIVRAEDLAHPTHCQELTLTL